MWFGYNNRDMISHPLQNRIGLMSSPASEDASADIAADISD